MPRKSNQQLQQEQQFKDALNLAAILREKIKAEQYEERLEEFLKGAWGVISPGSPFMPNWHISCICLPYNTKIQTSDGIQPIGELDNYNGFILSWNHQENKAEWKPVVSWMKSIPEDMVRVETDTVELRLTGNHPVFTKERGYVRADQLRPGESVLDLQAVRKEFLPISVPCKRELLQYALFRRQQDTSQKALYRLRFGDLLGSQEALHTVSQFAKHAETEWCDDVVQAMRDNSVSHVSSMEGNGSDFWSILQPKVFRSVCDRPNESGILQRQGSRTISSEVQIRQAKSNGARTEQMLPLWLRGEVCGQEAPILELGCTSYRQRQEEQRFVESSSSLSELSQKTRDSGSGWTIIRNVAREVSVPDYVYNIEVADNNNYFAENILVHNCEHLEALSRREIRRLIINIPPRSLKSVIISVAFPAWRWIKAPQEKFLCASYSKNFALRDSRRTRNLIMNPWYQQKWSDRFQLADDQNEKGRFENNKGGQRFTASVETGVLGEGGSFSIYDDPNDLDKMKFPEYRQAVKDWYSGSAASRFIDPKTDVRICVQQRSSYGDDLTSYLMELGGWEQLVIPNEYDGNTRVSSIGWRDPRTHLGELLHPERFGPQETAQIKIDQRDNYQGQYNQNPASMSGDALKMEWFNFYNPPGTVRVDEFGKLIPVRIRAGVEVIEKIPVELPAAFEQVVQSWDLAFKDQEHNDYVSGQAWGRVGANSFLLARDHGHKNFPDTLSSMRKMNGQFPCPEKLVEDKANGPAVISTLRNEIPGLIPVNPEGGKWSRVAAISGYVEAGNIYLPNPDLFPWVWDLLKEFSDSRAAKHDDDTDAMTQALKRLYDSMAQQGVPEFRVQPRLGEPRTASHIMQEKEFLPPSWRRVISVIPDQGALWLVETPTGSLRIEREASLEKMDALSAGREVSKLSLQLALSRLGSQQKGGVEMILPKLAFVPIEPHGCWAELFERGVTDYIPEEGDWDLREKAKIAIQAARFRTDMGIEDQSSLDRLRELLAWAPPDFQKIPYNRKKALEIARESLEAYAEYMAAVEGEVRGEWPKLKISPSCPALISQMGAFRRDRLDEAPSLVRALLQGLSVPVQAKPQVIKEVPARQVGQPQRGVGMMGPRRFRR